MARIQAPSAEMLVKEGWVWQGPDWVSVFMHPGL